MFRLRKPNVPPKTRRWCAICKKETTFCYNTKVLHSCCEECGSRCSFSNKEAAKDFFTRKGLPWED